MIYQIASSQQLYRLYDDLIIAKKSKTLLNRLLLQKYIDKVFWPSKWLLPLSINKVASIHIVSISKITCNCVGRRLLRLIKNLGVWMCNIVSVFVEIRILYAKSKQIMCSDAFKSKTRLHC